MTFQETLDFLYSQLPVFHRTGASAYKKDLSRTLALLEFLGNPHQNLQFVHVAGTNGKGSTSHMLASVLQESGYKTGLYTSPHLKHFGERIKINGAYIDEHFVVEFTEHIRPELAAIEPSFFELTVAMAMAWFAQQKVDIAVIETGLGGRLDSTNVIQPLVSVITNISYDHMDLLGNTLPEIALEKSGIIKAGALAVISERQPEIASVFEIQAQSVDTPLFFASDHFQVMQTSSSEKGMTCRVTEGQSTSFELTSELQGNYQLKNIAGVLQAINALREKGIVISEEQVKKGIARSVTNTGLKGRWQIIGRQPLVVCDIAHNAAGIALVLDQVQSILSGNLFIVFGMVKDKDQDKVLALLPKNAHYFFTQANSPRSLSKELLKEKAEYFGLHGICCESADKAIEAALKVASECDVVLVCGSAFLIAEVKKV